MKNLKSTMKKIVLIFLCFSFCQCNDFDDRIEDISFGELIQKDSELYETITKVVTPGNSPQEAIVCLDFIYPFKLLIYDVNKNIIGEKVLVSDNEFSGFLGGLPVNQSISISYPIQTKLQDGTIFSVNNNSELKLAIDSCSKEDIIAYCSSLFGGGQDTKCVWKSAFSTTTNNKYAGGIFDTNGDGTLNFYYDDKIYKGTWTFLFVDDKLHLNISLAGSTAVAQFWSIDKEIVFGESSITILALPKNILLEKVCETKEVYTLGQTGPAGGIVFFDKGFYSFGWRFLEVSNTDVDNLDWGCLGSLVDNSSKIDVGMGWLNSIQIANFHDNLNGFYTNPAVCNAANNGTVAAKSALTFEFQNKKDWFLPSQDELNLLYTNLKLQNLGAFSNKLYWSSSQNDVNTAKTINFTDGTKQNSSKTVQSNDIKARFVRAF
jgi:hypothetical protein